MTIDAEGIEPRVAGRRMRAAGHAIVFIVLLVPVGFFGWMAEFCVRYRLELVIHGKLVQATVLKVTGPVRVGTPGAGGRRKEHHEYRVTVQFDGHVATLNSRDAHAAGSKVGFVYSTRDPTSYEMRDTLLTVVDVAKELLLSEMVAIPIALVVFLWLALGRLWIVWGVLVGKKTE